MKDIKFIKSNISINFIHIYHHVLIFFLTPTKEEPKTKKIQNENQQKCIHLSVGCLLPSVCFKFLARLRLEITSYSTGSPSDYSGTKGIGPTFLLSH